MHSLAFDTDGDCEQDVWRLVHARMLEMHLTGAQVRDVAGIDGGLGVRAATCRRVCNRMQADVDGPPHRKKHRRRYRSPVAQACPSRFVRTPDRSPAHSVTRHSATSAAEDAVRSRGQAAAARR